MNGNGHCQCDARLRSAKDGQESRHAFRKVMHCDGYASEDACKESMGRDTLMERMQAFY